MLRSDAYRVKRGDNLASADFWNERLFDIDLRLAARENDAADIAAATDALLAAGLQRLDETFTPLILDAQDRLNNLGATFSAESLTTITIETGEKSFTLTDESAESYVYTDYVSIRAADDETNTMLGRVVSFDRGAKLLVVDVILVEGSGIFSDWLIRVGAPPDVSHAGRTDNPHSVTAAQVGAYTTTQTDSAINAALASINLEWALDKSQNLNDLADKSAARDNLGLKSGATTDLSGKLFPAGTAILFFQASAPFGWSKSTAHDNKAIRIVSGTSGGTGAGTVDFSTVFARTATDNFTLTSAHMPTHNHGVTDNAHSHVYYDYGVGSGGNPVYYRSADWDATLQVNNNYERTSNGAYAGISIQNAGSGGAHGHGIDLRVKYIDAIICTKD